MQQDLERVARNRYGSWISSLLLILALAGFVALAIYFAPQYVAGLTGWQLVAFGLMMALVPALLWLIFFYLQDRLSPEPKGNVFGVFVLGGLLAAAIGQPVIERIFQVQDWMYTTWWVQLLASILVIGFVQEFLVYASVRYSIYRSRDFDERVDGVIYAIAAGLGYATVLNFQYVMQHGGVDVGVGAMTVTINALAQAGFAGIIGYFLGQAKFETTPRYWLATRCRSRGRAERRVFLLGGPSHNARVELHTAQRGDIGRRVCVRHPGDRLLPDPASQCRDDGHCTDAG